MKEFKVKPNLAVGIWLGALTLVWVYDIVMFVLKSLDQQSFIIVSIFLAVLYFYFLGCRPYKYIVDGKTLIFKRRLLPQKEVDLMSCEVICDPVSRMADLVTRPHAIELYTDLKKRYSTFPKDRYEFVDAICESNKRIHCTVPDYTDQHRKIEKKERRENRRRRKINKRS